MLTSAIQSLDGAKPNTNPNTNPKTNPNPKTYLTVILILTQTLNLFPNDALTLTVKL